MKQISGCTKNKINQYIFQIKITWLQDASLEADLYRVYVRVQALTRTCAWGPPRAQHNKNWGNQTRVGDLEVTYGCWAYLKEKKTFEKIVYSLSSKCLIFKKVLSHIFYFITDQNPGHKIGQNAIFTSKVFISSDVDVGVSRVSTHL